MNIITADIGGTKVGVAFYSFYDERFELKFLSRYLSSDFPSIEEVLKQFISEFSIANIDAISLGIAGPIIDERSDVTNLDWIVDGRNIKKVFSCSNVFLLNDLQAHAYGVLILDDDGFITLSKGIPKPGNMALVAAGTGLGEAALYWDGKDYFPSSTEGGHTSFAPINEEEIALLVFAMKKWGQVSAERLISGSFGFPTLFEFYKQQSKYNIPSSLEKKFNNSDDIAPIIVEAADSGDPLCMDIVKMFVSLYGSEAGNLALKTLAISGVYIGGGIAPKMLSWIKKDNVFFNAFCNKDRFNNFLADIPLYIITDENNALKGAAFYAVKQLQC